MNIRPTCRIPVKLESRFGDFLKNATLGKYEVRVVREQNTIYFSNVIQESTVEKMASILSYGDHALW